MNDQPIGFIDSGVGGLSVVKETMKELPNEEILFIGDSARNPYGPRSVDEVFQFSRELAYFLIKKGIKILVIACNTATAAALSKLQKELPIPVIGVIEAGSRTATQNTKNKKIGVIGTIGTINSEEYDKKLKKLDASVETYNLANSTFVEIVENNQFRDESVKNIIREELLSFKDTEIDTLILGCTHYPLLQPAFQNVLGNGIKVIDPSVETVKELKQYLIDNHQENWNRKLKQHVFYTTGSKEKFEVITNSWLENKNFHVEKVSLEELRIDDE